jgi:hypothetical protein
MNARRVFYALLLAAVAALAAVGLTYLKAPQTPETHILSGIATSTGSFEYTEDHPYYTVDIVYPETHNQNEQTIIETALKSTADDFAQNIDGLDPSVMPSLAQGYKLALNIDYARYAGARATTSYLFTVYEDTGGAHPNTFFTTFVFDARGQQLALKDLLGRNPQWLEELSLRASDDIVAQMKKRLGQDDVTGAIFADGLAPKEENFQTFIIDKEDLLIEIPPYQVAPYAAGSFEVRLSLSDLDH